MQELLSSLGPVTAVIGAQWGDEGKGKATDMLAEHYDIIGRACGGANAGHTIVIDGQKHVFHLLPSGCFHEGKQVVLGAGMVLHLPTLLEEIHTLKEHGIDILDRLHISPAAHIVFDYHREIDGALEQERTQKEGQGIGTTKRGIGPAYMDKAARTGMRMERMNEDLTGVLTQRRDWAQRVYGVHIDVDQECAHLREAAAVLQGRVADTVALLHFWMQEGKTVIVEGAQATLLDIDHGTYPYVTSSSTTAAGALQGLGVPPRSLTSCIGVAKAYCTRVGSGPFRTEMEEELGNRIREKGGEYGATTGRPRRCGWLHIPDLLRTVQINGFSQWNVTKLDVLDDEAEILVGVDEKDGNAVFETVPGWQTSTVGITHFEDLPEQAKSYITFIEEKTGVPVALIGTGPDREQMIVKA
ncbi:adenylosuccinate synthase [Candidatus Peregrinibacteria bacterium CG10_big_fil_rev_8_21_14_0_10_49_10]|nr:MAG: adenylosuccinate synthase [Candidatus Peregrinibacteria bacterium CG10_big_fil_rev_8_21_14_0_10_49_10]